MAVEAEYQDDYAKGEDAAKAAESARAEAGESQSEDEKEVNETPRR